MLVTKETVVLNSNLFGMSKSKIFAFLGWLIILAVWFIISALELINPYVFPSPIKVYNGFIEMINHDNLVKNIFFSLKINFMGYAESILLALPVGFLLGLSPTVRKVFSQPIDSLRFIPITALGGIFIAISGLGIMTKVHFLAFGIWVYLVPVIVQRIDEISTTQLQMMKTLGATKWQMFKHLQWRSVISRLSDDIRILVGISWTYIIVAELKNVEGGLGSLIFLGERQGAISKVYVSIIIIVIIGMLQDKLFKFLDKQIFKFKHT
jgi:NitT/TauT family transport system permease protein